MNYSQLFDKQFTEEKAYRIFVERVQYKATKGADGIDRLAFKSLIPTTLPSMMRKVRTCNYRFSPYKAKLMLRGEDKFPRKVERPTVRDKVVLRLLYDYLVEVYAPELDPRKLHRQVKQLISVYSSGQFSSVLKFDVRNFYPSIDHNLLIRTIRRRIRSKEALSLIASAIRTPSDSAKREGKQVNQRGVPQGLSISNVLSSIYLMGFDRKYSSLGTISYFRYVDDILILCNDIDKATLFSSVRADLHRRKLELGSKDKTLQIGLQDEFDYLGYLFSAGKISIRTSSVQKIRDSIMRILSSYIYSTFKSVEILSFKLNLRVTGCIIDRKKYGWMFYFSQTNDRQLLHGLDCFVRKQLARYDLKEVRPKRFMRTWYEINKNLRKTRYIPNFDLFTHQEKERVLSWFGELSEDAAEAEFRFRTIVYKEIRDLERDMADFS